MPYSFTCMIIALALIAQIHAIPILSRSHQESTLYHTAPSSTLKVRDLATCQDPHAGIDPSCWDLLGLETFLNTWKTNTPVCPPGPTTGNCCGATEAWSTCFLRMYQPESGTDCTSISSCAFSPSLAEIPQGSTMTAQVHYIIYNIYGT